MGRGRPKKVVSQQQSGDDVILQPKEEMTDEIKSEFEK